MASAAITSFQRNVGNGCGFRPLESHWHSWLQMSTVLNWWCPGLPGLSRSLAGCLSPHYSQVICCTVASLWRESWALTQQTTTKTTVQENILVTVSHQSGSILRTSSKFVFPRVWILYWIAVQREEVPAVVLFSAAIPRVNIMSSFPVPFCSTYWLSVSSLWVGLVETGLCVHVTEEGTERQKLCTGRPICMQLDGITLISLGN